MSRVAELYTLLWMWLRDMTLFSTDNSIVLCDNGLSLRSWAALHSKDVLAAPYEADNWPGREHGARDPRILSD